MPADSTSNRPYILFSTDCHAGADLRDYKPYLAQRWHDEFDAWADTYYDAWGEIDRESDFKAGISSFLDPINWNSQKRVEVLEAEGIVAEVLFPNTAPPFFPNGALAAPGPRTAEEYDRRWAGVQAHNRWLKDFCDEVPGRRFGIAQLFIDHVDDTLAEIRWAKEAGLRGLLLPGDHHLKLHNLYYREYEPIWDLCEELDIPIGRHGGIVSSDEDPGSIDAAHAVGVYETLYFAQRTLSQMVLAGVFERHPNLKFTFTETGTGSWVVDAANNLDHFVRGSREPDTLTNMFAAKAIEKLSMLPSEYARRNVWVNAMMIGTDAERRHEVGLDRLMWGADFPHHEGSAPHTLKVLRGSLATVPEAELRVILGETGGHLYGADLDFLQTVADRVGPTPEQVAEPLRREEIPDDPNFAHLGNPNAKRTFLA